MSVEPTRLPVGPFLYPIVDVDWLSGRPVGGVVAELGRSGVRVVQLRAKDVADRRFLLLAREAARAAHVGGMLLIINDRPDLALIAEADGVHLGQDDLPPELVRRLLPPGAMLGLSAHSLVQVTEAERQPLDYVAVGPIFSTSTKKRPDPALGIDFVRQARVLTAKPLVAIGGIGIDATRQLVRAGADGIAVISGLLAAPDLYAAARRFQAALVQ